MLQTTNFPGCSKVHLIQEEMPEQAFHIAKKTSIKLGKHRNVL